MDAAIMLLADFANVDAAGKLNVIGAFNQVFTPRFPMRLAQMHVVIRLVANLGEFDQERTLKVMLFDEDRTRQLWATPEIPFKIPPPSQGKLRHHDAIIGLQRFAFDRPGTYEFVAHVNGEYKASVTLDVVQLEPNQESGAI